MAGANFGKWVRKSAWTIGEAAYLLCGKEPPPSIKSNKDIAAGGAEVDEMYQALKRAAKSPGAPLHHPVAIPGEEPETSIVRPTAAPLPGFVQQPRIVREAAPPWYWVTSVAREGFPIPNELIFLSKSHETTEQRDDQMLERFEELENEGHRSPRKQVAKEFGLEEDATSKALTRARKRRAAKKNSGGKSAGGYEALQLAMTAPAPKRKK